MDIGIAQFCFSLVTFQSIARLMNGTLIAITKVSKSVCGKGVTLIALAAKWEAGHLSGLFTSVREPKRLRVPDQLENAKRNCGPEFDRDSGSSASAALNSSSALSGW